MVIKGNTITPGFASAKKSRVIHPAKRKPAFKVNRMDKGNNWLIQEGTNNKNNKIRRS
jgi:hypothetical protein